MYERQSHPTGVRGLKFEIKTANANRGRVAPHWGAWIEIDIKEAVMVDETVAPHWGAWIEIPKPSQEPSIEPGRTPLGCVD